MLQPVVLSATASSGLPVTYGMVGSAVLTGNVITRTGPGEIKVVAWQAGDQTWEATDPVMHTLISSEARLISLVPSGVFMLTPFFNSGWFFYTAPAVDASVSGISISASSLDANATITANGVPVPRGGFPASAPVPLQYGPNSIAVVCTAQDGITTRTYTVSITRLTEIQTWRRLHFGTPDEMGDASDFSDPDFDGLTNRVEFAFGFHPLTAGTAVLPSWTRNGTEYVITFPQPSGVAGISYIGEWSTTLDGPWTPLPDTGNAPQHRFAAPVAGTARLFLRVRVETSAP